MQEIKNLQMNLENSYIKKLEEKLTKIDELLNEIETCDFLNNGLVEKWTENLKKIVENSKHINNRFNCKLHWILLMENNFVFLMKYWKENFLDEFNKIADKIINLNSGENKIELKKLLNVLGVKKCTTMRETDLSTIITTNFPDPFWFCNEWEIKKVLVNKAFNNDTMSLTINNLNFCDLKEFLNKKNIIGWLYSFKEKINSIISIIKTKNDVYKLLSNIKNANYQLYNLNGDRFFSINYEEKTKDLFLKIKNGDKEALKINKKIDFIISFYKKFDERSIGLYGFDKEFKDEMEEFNKIEDSFEREFKIFKYKFEISSNRFYLSEFMDDFEVNRVNFKNKDSWAYWISSNYYNIKASIFEDILEFFQDYKDVFSN